MSQIKKPICAGLIAASFLALGSCSDDANGVSVPDAPRGELSLRVQLDSGSASGTRAPGDSESRVTGVSVLLFTVGADSKPEALWDCVEARNLTPRTGGYYFDASIDLDGGDVPATLTAMLLCNAAPDDVAALRGKSPAEVSQALTRTFSAATCADITMSGQCTPVIETRLASQQLRASVVRDRARVDINASAVDPDIFSLSEVYVYRHNNLIALLPDGDTAPCVPSGATKVPSGRFDVVPSGNIVEAQVYIPEADVLMGGDGDPSDGSRLQRTAIVVGGSYRGSAATSYYRIDFTDADGKLIDVLRNHRYVANITAVNGPGSDTPDDAYTSVSAGVTATILDWDRTDQYIVFDGAHWFSVESRLQLVGPDAGNSGLMPVASDIPASEWKMAWSDSDELPDDMSGAASLEGGIFRVTRPDGDVADGGSLLFEALSALPDGVTERSEVLHILAGGRLHLCITVTQCDLTASPWTDGGTIDFK